MVESSFYITIVFSIAVSLLFFILQFKYFRETRKYCNLFYDFFYKESEYEVIKEDVDGNQIQQLKLVGEQESDLNRAVRGKIGIPHPSWTDGYILGGVDGNLHVYMGI